MNQWAPLGDTMHITTLKTLGGYGYQREGQTVGRCLKHISPVKQPTSLFWMLVNVLFKQ